VDFQQRLKEDTFAEEMTSCGVATFHVRRHNVRIWARNILIRDSPKAFCAVPRCKEYGPLRSRLLLLSTTRTCCNGG
jgi:hypothetical protein